jgi:hypothetical protein
MASETSEKVAWGLLGLALGAGGMYVLAKEDVWKPNPVNMEEGVEVLNTTGDVNALDYGGGVVYHNPEYDTIAWEWWDGAYDENGAEVEGGPGVEYTVYRRDVPDDVTAEFDWANWAQVASSVGEDEETLREMGRSDNVMERVRVMEDLVGYYGPHELDSYALNLTYEEMIERWPMFA